MGSGSILIQPCEVKLGKALSLIHKEGTETWVEILPGAHLDRK